MLAVQVLINALVLGCLYACIAIGFSLVWGVLNVINLIHGSFIVLGAYLAFGAYQWAEISPWYALVIAAPLFFAFGYLLQRLLLNRVITAPVLVTLTLTFGLDLILNNAMIYYFKADYRKLTLSPPTGSVSLFDVVVPVDRLIATASALALTSMLYLLLRRSKVGRAIIAVRLDRDAAVLMGVDVKSIYAIAFGLGAALASFLAVMMQFTIGGPSGAKALKLARAKYGTGYDYCGTAMRSSGGRHSAAVRFLGALPCNNLLK